MNISNEFTSLEDQNIESRVKQPTNIQSVTLSAVACEGGEIVQQVNINDATAQIDYNANQNAYSSTDTIVPPASGFDLDYLTRRQNDLNRASNSDPNIYDTATNPVTSTSSDYNVPPFLGNTFDTNVTTTFSGYPNFGANDPLNNPNRPYSVNDTTCNAALWSLLTIPCPTCNGGKKQALKNKAGKKYVDITKFIQRISHNPRINLSGVDDLINGVIQTVDVTQLFHNKECPTCKGENTVKDETGKINQNAKKVAQHLNDNKDKIMKAEQKAGGTSGCGNRVTIIGGHDLLEVGLGMNKTKSYLDYDTWAPGHVRIGGGVEHIKTTGIAGRNVPATPGGHYTIKCSNKFTCFTGAQGIELITYGPVNIAGGITKITGPEVTVGSSTGSLTLEGNHLQLNGKTIGISPNGADTQVVVQGTLGVNSNLIVNGSAHVNGDISCTSITMPSKISSSKISSQSDMNTGGANWSGLQPFAIKNQLANMKKNIGMMTIAPELTIASLKGMQKVAEDTTHLMYLGLPFEPLPTGIINTGAPVTLAVSQIAFASITGPMAGAFPVGGGGLITGATLIGTVAAPVPLHNFPHHHNLPDMFHTHDVETANIKTMTDSDAVVAQSRPKESSLPGNAVSDNDSIPSMLRGLLAIPAIALERAKKTMLGSEYC